jgi:hypothetical protein
LELPSEAANEYMPLELSHAADWGKDAEKLQLLTSNAYKQASKPNKNQHRPFGLAFLRSPTLMASAQ